MCDKAYVVIPLGGIGDRFRKAGYVEPKPFVRAAGKCILKWLLDSLDYTLVHALLIPYNDELAACSFEGRVRSWVPQHVNMVFIRLPPSGTRGAADTARIALEQIQDVDRPVVFLDGDNFYRTTNILNLVAAKNCIVCFEPTWSSGETSPYSHVQLSLNGTVQDIVEKKRVGPFACTGSYAFRSWRMAYDCAKKFLSTEQEGEFYTSGLISLSIKNGELFDSAVVDSDDFVCLGTPADVRVFSLQERVSDLRLCFSLHLMRNAELARFATNAKAKGCYLMIYSDRHHTDHYDSALREARGLGYNEIYIGKRPAGTQWDICIDHEMSMMEIQRTTGIFCGDMVSPRKCNTITPISPLPVLRKKSMNPKKLKGEIWYYQHIPSSIRDLFPLLIRHDTMAHTWYDVEQIEGFPLSTVYLNLEMTNSLLDQVISSLLRIHTTLPLRREDMHIAQENLYKNYTQKVETCYSSYDYTIFRDYEKVYHKVLAGLKNYQEASVTMIHGDPVFTNIILDKNKCIRFIDMRGLQGDTITTCGDPMYDWAKVHQSLLGYDEVREGVTLPQEYKEGLRKYFEARFVDLFGSKALDHLTELTRSLFFSLIPHHGECLTVYDYFSLAANI